MPLLMLPSALWFRRSVSFSLVYLAIWFALALLALRVPWMSFGAWATLAGGAYELTPMKRRFLDRCRSERGLSHGLDCLGASAGLMVAFFGLGWMSVWWMTAAAVVVFAEKVARFGPQLAVPAGFVLLTLGLTGIA